MMNSAIRNHPDPNLPNHKITKVSKEAKGALGEQITWVTLIKMRMLRKIALRMVDLLRTNLKVISSMANQMTPIHINVVILKMMMIMGRDREGIIGLTMSSTRSLTKIGTVVPDSTMMRKKSMLKALKMLAARVRATKTKD